jgi:AmpE protein
MTLLTVILVLVAEQWLLAYQHLRQPDWFARWLELHQSLPAPASLRGGATGVIGLLLPPLLGLALVWMLLEWLLGPAGLVLSALVLLYSLGPGETAAQVRALQQASDAHGTAAAARALLGRAPDLADPARDLTLGVLGAMHRQTIAVLLWFLPLGPVGALGYRLTRELVWLARDQERQALAAAATRLLLWLDWPVARLMGGLLALGGCFETALEGWRQCNPAGEPEPGLAVTRCAAAGALQLDARPRADAPLDPVLLDRALRLARRCLALLLGLWLLVTLGGWLG